MTTLKEAYESVGETIKLGDVLCGERGVEYVEGWNYALEGDSVLLYRAEKIKHEVTDTIFRNGKQIYPKVEEAPWNLGIYSKEQKEAWSNLEASLRQFKERNEFGDSAILANTIFAMINATIKENKKMKKN